MHQLLDLPSYIAEHNTTSFNSLDDNIPISSPSYTHFQDIPGPARLAYFLSNFDSFTENLCTETQVLHPPMILHQRQCRIRGSRDLMWLFWHEIGRNWKLFAYTEEVQCSGWTNIVLNGLDNSLRDFCSWQISAIRELGLNVAQLRSL